MLPPIHDIAPFSVSQWNHVKGGQDVVSRILKNVKVDFRSLTPRAFIIIRFVMISLMNAHMVRRLLLHEDRLDNFSSYTHLKQFLNKEAAFWDFLKMFATEWKPSPRFITHVSDAAQLGLADNHPIDSVPSGGPFKRRPNAIGSTGWFPRRAVQHVFVQMSTMSGFLCHGRNAQSVALRQRLPVMYVAYTFVVKRLLSSDTLVGTFFIHPSDSKRESAHHVKPGREVVGADADRRGTQDIIEEALPPRQRRRSSQQNVNH